LINTKKLRDFSTALAVFCGIFGTLNAWRGHVSWSVGFLSVGITAQMIGGIRPELMKPVFIVLITIAKAIGWINTRILLILIFYGLFTPIGLVLRLFRRDLLNQKIDRNAKTYWIDRSSPTINPKHYEKQF